MDAENNALNSTQPIQATNLPDKKEPTLVSSLSIESLTDQQWLFIKYFLETSDLMSSYRNAGYEGKLTSAPYQLFKKLKPVIEEIVNTDLTSKLKFNQDLSKALSLPLVKKEALTVSEWLRLRKFAATLTPDLQQDKPRLSVLIINRPVDKGTTKGSDVINHPSDPNTNDVIDAELI